MPAGKSLSVFMVALALLAPAGSALAVQLVSVTVDPVSPTADHPVSLLATLYATRNIVTGRPTVTFDPTFRSFDVELGATEGPLFVVTTHVEDIVLGYLEPGPYGYTVTLHSGPPSPWDRSLSGQFFVDVPEPAGVMLLAVGGALAGRRRRR
jgi:hypothetical protein